MKKRVPDEEDAELWDDEYQGSSYDTDSYDQNPGPGPARYDAYDRYDRYEDPEEDYGRYQDEDEEEDDERDHRGGREKPRYYYDQKKGWVKEKSRGGSDRGPSRSRREAPRSNTRRVKKKHRALPIVLLILILVIGLPLVWLLARIRGMQADGLSFTDVADSISEEVKNSMSSGPMAGYRNIAILGVDSITGSLDEGNNRSDVMIIASINEKTGDIKLMSVYRDTYLDVGDGTYSKANAAYAYGGPTQTVEMLNKNLDLNITDYAVVGFEGIARIVDAVGGVEIDVQQDEIEHLNNYQLTMSQETGMEDIPVTQPGLQTLNGLQATAYCRIRYTAGNDFKRTERQREVLTKVFEKIKKNPIKALASANALMSYVKTSMNMGELSTLAVQAFRFSIQESTGFPNEDLRTVGYIGDQSCVIPITLAKNVTWLHGELFGDTDYTPSQTVQDISAHVSQVSGYY